MPWAQIIGMRVVWVADCIRQGSKRAMCETLSERLSYLCTLTGLTSLLCDLCSQECESDEALKRRELGTLTWEKLFNSWCTITTW